MDGKVGGSEARMASLGSDAMGAGGVMELMLGHTEDGTLGHEGMGADGHEGMGADRHEGTGADGHKGTVRSGHKGTGADGHEGMGADEPMEEMLGGTEDGPEDDGMEQVTMVEFMVWEASMNWEQSLREAHRHQRMAQVVTMFGWLLGPECVGWGLVPAKQFSVEDAA